jgi:hypothetical protein
MRKRAFLIHGALATGNAFQQVHALLHGFERIDVHQIGAGQAVLRDQDKFALTFQFRKQLSGLAFEGGDPFSAHKSDAKVSLQVVNTFGGIGRGAAGRLSE